MDHVDQQSLHALDLLKTVLWLTCAMPSLPPVKVHPHTSDRQVAQGTGKGKTPTL